MPDMIARADPDARRSTALERPAGAQGRDRAARPRHLHRVVAAGASLAAQAADVRARRARRVVGLGALPRLLRGARLGRTRHQPAQPLLVADRRPDDALVRHVPRGRRRGTRSARARRPWRRARDGRSARPEGRRTGRDLGARAHRRRSCRATCGRLPGSYELREVPEVYGRSLIGWETLPERLLRDDRDLTLADVLRIQHLLGQKPHESGAARRQVLAGIPVDRGRCRRGAAARHRWRPGPDASRSTTPSGWPSGSMRSSSRSAPTPTTA